MGVKKAAPVEPYEPERSARVDVSREGGTGLRAEKNPTPVLRIFPDRDRPYHGIWLYQGAGFGAGDQDYDEATGICLLKLCYRGAVEQVDPTTGEIRFLFADYLLRIEGKGQKGFEYLCYQLSKQTKSALHIGMDREERENPVEIISMTLTQHTIAVAEGMPMLS